MLPSESATVKNGVRSVELHFSLVFVVSPAGLLSMRSRGARWVLAATLAVGLISTRPAVVSAQSESDDKVPKRHEPTRIYFGMWTTHLNHEGVALDNNWVVGLTYRGFFGATFLNSFGRRAFTAGIQRTLVASAPRPIGASLGLRIGLVSGYDGRFMQIARDTPVLPFAQPFVTIDIHHVGVEVSYTFVVVSVAASYRF
jgi:hypothetical protein